MSGVKGKSGGARKGAGMPKGKKVKSPEEKKSPYSTVLSFKSLKILEQVKNKARFIDQAIIEKWERENK